MVLGLFQYVQKLDPDNYWYFDTPDGEDCHRKLLFMAKYSALAGVVIASYDVLLYSHPQGYGPIAFRYGYWIAPLVTMGAAYSIGTCFATKFRKEDDILNHAVGGVAAGYVWGAIRKTIAGGARAAILSSIFGMACKACDMYGYKMFPLPRVKRIAYFENKLDLSLYRDPDEEVEKVQECPK